MAGLAGSYEASRRLRQILAVATMTILSANRADALSCVYEQLSLEASYARAEGIIVAQVLGCADGAIPEGTRCPDSHYHLETLEVLKEPEPWKSLSGAYHGGDGLTRCGQLFELGESYLLFVDGSGSTIYSAGGALHGSIRRHVKPDVGSTSCASIAMGKCPTCRTLGFSPTSACRVSSSNAWAGTKSRSSIHTQCPRTGSRTVPNSTMTAIRFW